MRSLRVLLFLVVSMSAFAACKKGAGYIHTAPTPEQAPPAAP